MLCTLSSPFDAWVTIGNNGLQLGKFLAMPETGCSPARQVGWKLLLLRPECNVSVAAIVDWDYIRDIPSTMRVL